jgi:hypothetical protein
MIYLPLLLLAIALFELFAWLRMTQDAKAIIARSQEAMRVLQSTQMGDDEKEVFMRQASLESFKATFRFALKFLLAGGVLYALYRLTITFFPHLEEPLLESFVSPVALVGVTLAVMVYARARKTIFARRQAGQS